ncbi:MAG: hypothetical protein KDA24_09850 [Deltaproteobacteria bacterium]|nr:hypothetical protein [Deltaproteobacteria bacterium]
MSKNALALLGAVLFGAACNVEMPGADKPQVIVRHRCGDVNFKDLNGYFGKLQGENGVNSKFRVQFGSADGKLTARWAPGGFDVTAYEGTKTGEDTAVFTEVGSGERKRVWATITNDCRIEAQMGTVSGDGTEAKSPIPADKYVPFEDLKSRDFEPCTEVLYTGRAAKSHSSAKSYKKPATPPVVRSSNMPVAAWGPTGEVGPGCTAHFDLWTDGKSMEVIGAETVEERDGMLRWHHPYENDFLGLHGVAMHRKVKCNGGEAKLLGVACLQVEVK